MLISCLKLYILKKNHIFARFSIYNSGIKAIAYV